MSYNFELERLGVYMEKRIISYRKYMDSLLEKDDNDWEFLRREHLVQIQFFQHERLIHLIVTALFALMEIISVIATVATGYLWLLVLVAVLMVLLVPYIRHYYILENEVQKMYAQYDIIINKGNKYENNSVN